jgi:thiamine-phosphate pyrophosphorylase
MAEAASRLYLITPPLSEAAAFVAAFQSALEAGDVACVLLRLAKIPASEMKKIISALMPLAQKHDAALLVEDALLAARCGADGVHVAGLGATLEAALAAMKPERIVGIGGLLSRHEAMEAGEAGVDYVMFGGPEESEELAYLLERIAWWAEIFTVPCVAYAPRLEDVGALAAAGADFLALGDAVWEHPEGAAAAVKAAIRALAHAQERVA